VCCSCTGRPTACWWPTPSDPTVWRVAFAMTSPLLCRCCCPAGSVCVPAAHHWHCLLVRPPAEAAAAAAGRRRRGCSAAPTVWGPQVGFGTLQQLMVSEASLFTAGDAGWLQSGTVSEAYGLCCFEFTTSVCTSFGFLLGRGPADKQVRGSQGIAVFAAAGYAHVPAGHRPTQPDCSV
jgi:hypothetical protein